MQRIATFFQFMFLALSLNLFFLSTSVVAQTDQESGLSYEPNEVIGDLSSSTNSDFTPKDEYIEINHSTLSKLYWAIGKFTLTDNEAIDYYIMINDCELHTAYFGNEVEWLTIRESMRKHLEQKVATFPTRLEIVVPIYLDRYDPKKEIFPINEKANKVHGTRKIDSYAVMSSYSCRRMRVNEVMYPKNIIVYLEDRIHLPAIPVKQELATLYMQEADKRYRNIPERLRESKYERVAYLRLKIKVNAYKETIRLGGGGAYKAIVMAKTEGIEVYADEKKTKLLYSKDIYEFGNDWRSNKKNGEMSTTEDILKQLQSGDPLIKPKEDEKEKENKQ